MEILIFAEEFQPYDLKALRHFAGQQGNPVVESAKGICATNRLVASASSVVINARLSSAGAPVRK